MAKGKRVPLEQAQAVAEEIVGMLQDSCEKMMVVGSVRRKCPDCADVDIVVIPKYEERVADLFGEKERVSLFDQALEQHGFKLKIEGPAKKVTDYRGVEVDFYITDKEGFVMLGFIRTGSAENNVRLASAAKRQGMKLAYADGCIYRRSGEKAMITDERQIYEILGLPWQEPEDR